MQIDFAQTHQCLNEGCTCTVGSNQVYCSERCREAAHSDSTLEVMPQECKCDHSQCHRAEA